MKEKRKWKEEERVKIEMKGGKRWEKMFKMFKFVIFCSFKCRGEREREREMVFDGTKVDAKLQKSSKAK